MTFIPIVVGVASTILWRTFVPEILTVEVYQWVYSTIVQAFAAMVAVVGMFAIYKLQLLRSSLEMETQGLKAAVVEINGSQYLEDYTGVVPKEGLTVSDNFIGDEKAFQNLGEEIRQGTKTIFDLRKTIEKKAKAGLHNEDKLKDMYLVQFGEVLNLMNDRYKRIENTKERVTRTRKTIKIPLVISGFLIGTSLFLLSLSDKNITDTASSVFLWLLAIVIGTAICLTYMLIREILVLVET